MPTTIPMTAELLDAWLRMPMFMSFDKEGDTFRATKTLLLEGGDALKEAVLISRNMVKEIEKQYDGDRPRALKIARRKMEKVLDARIRERFPKGAN